MSMDHYGEPPWDIPVVPLPGGVRERLYQAALEQAKSAGFLLPLKEGGSFIAWADPQETAWLGRSAFRVWAAAEGRVLPEDLGALSARLEAAGAQLAGLSAWREIPPHEAFLDVGASVHLYVADLVPHTSREVAIEVRPLGDVPASWIDRIVNHVGTTRWHDRQARDPRLPQELVERRRRGWVETSLRGGDGILLACLDGDGSLIAYDLFPFDRSRAPFGGPVLGGLNSILGRLGPGPSCVREMLFAGFRHPVRFAVDGWVLQYQDENPRMKRLVEELFVGPTCVRHDRHWHASRE
jgi:hypothetical protein